MGKINVLGFEIANLIAAGEVVDRPASVLKELLENALDAGASSITAEIRNGGISMIRVSDNGSGMSAEDLPVAIRRHATSKISSAEDLNSITTLGFRGEALAAIASVSELKIISKTADAESGTLLVASCGSVTEISEVGCADGTTVIVENLFGNVPARRKFLKRDATEAAAVSAMVEKVAMSRPEIAIRLIIDGSEKFSTAGDGSLKNTLYALLGRDFALRLLPVSGEGGGIAVSGFVGRSDNARGNRNAQNFFINGRYVRSKTVTAALERAYTSYLAPEKFPVAALFLTCNPQLVDVNVHPAKLEVRFSNEQAVFEAVYYAVRGALESSVERPEISLAPKQRTTHYRTDAAPIAADLPSYAARAVKVPSDRPLDTRKGSEMRTSHPARPSEIRPAELIAQSRSEATPKQSAEFLSAYRSGIERSGLGSVSLRATSGGFGSVPPSGTLLSGNPLPTVPGAEAAPEKQYRLIGDAFHTYLFLEFGDELLIVDQHAAHERVLFEELLKKQKTDGRTLSQTLLLPLTVELGDEAAEAAREYREDIRSVGYEFSLAENQRTASIEAIPDAIAIPDAEELFCRICGDLAEGQGNARLAVEQRRERALYQIACKAAIKGGRAYDAAHLAWLAEKLSELPDITVCPHGRPIAVRLTKSELDRRFDRIK